MSETAAAQPTVYFDGASSRRRIVELDFASDTLNVVEKSATLASWPYDDIRRADGRPGILRVSCMSAPELARLEIDDTDLAAQLLLRATLINKHEKERASTIKIVGWSLAAAVSIVFVALVGVPYAADQVTPFIPRSFENRFGEAAQKQLPLFFDGKTCEGADGKAAFTTLMEKVRNAGNLDTEIKASVIASAIPNAIALPGGVTLMFNGLLQKANNPDEIAAVMAHELGHVANRDHVRSMITNGGTSFLIGLLFGDVTGAGAAIFTANAIFNASHSRNAEEKADGFAIGVMHKLGRSPKPLGELLTRVTGTERQRSILSSHPVSAERLDRMTREDRPVTGAPLLTDAEWTALKKICG
jgi:Zn-dependent protease with chaperone function